MIGSRLVRWVPWCCLAGVALTVGVIWALNATGAFAPLQAQDRTGLSFIIGTIFGAGGGIGDAVRWGWL